MEDKVRKDLLYILKQASNFIKKRDALSLGKLSNWSIHTAGVFQDEDSISIAVLTYALFKVLERHESEKVNFDAFIKKIDAAAARLAKTDIEGYRKSVKELFTEISSIDTKVRFYFQKVVSKARIHRGSFLHAHGISVARTAELMGISQWQLMDYIGQTKVIDIEKHKMDVKKRLDLARRMFK